MARARAVQLVATCGVAALLFAAAAQAARPPVTQTYAVSIEQMFVSTGLQWTKPKRSTVAVRSARCAGWGLGENGAPAVRGTIAFVYSDFVCRVVTKKAGTVTLGVSIADTGDVSYTQMLGAAGAVPDLAFADTDVKVVGTGTGINYGPFLIPAGVYRFKFARWNALVPGSFDSIVVQAAARPGAPADLLINSTAATGANLVTLNGSRYLYVSFGGSDYVLSLQRVSS